MKRIVFILLIITLGLSKSFSQNPISIERVINELDWDNCIESDVILAFKDNVVKRENDETWDGDAISSFILKNVKVGNDVSDANIIVNKFNRKLIMIGGIMLGKNQDWGKGVEVISQKFEDYFSSFWGKEHKKSIDYDADIEDDNTVYTNIACTWGTTYHNNKSSKGSFLIRQRAKIIVISIEPK